jgi:hypothetical protein
MPDSSAPRPSKRPLQSFFWAIEHRDTNGLTSLVAEEAGDLFMRQFSENGPDAFWKEIGIVPGCRVTGTERQSDDKVQLPVQLIVRDETDDWTARRVGNRWAGSLNSSRHASHAARRRAP